MTAAVRKPKFRPRAEHAQTPQAVVPLPALKPGQRRMQVRAIDKEDAAEVVVRVSGYAWAAQIVGRPVRMGIWWMFRLEAEEGAGG